jgi:hypothetical protein
VHTSPDRQRLERSILKGRQVRAEGGCCAKVYRFNLVLEPLHKLINPCIQVY